MAIVIVVTFDIEHVQMTDGFGKILPKKLLAGVAVCTQRTIDGDGIGKVFSQSMNLPGSIGTDEAISHVIPAMLRRDVVAAMVMVATAMGPVVAAVRVTARIVVR